MERLVELRRSANCTQAAVAEYLGVARNTYSRYETGEREPDFETLKKLAEYFETSISYLLEETNDPAPPNTPPPVYDEEALELMEEMHQRPEMRVLFKTSKKATKADIEAVNELIKHMIGEETDD